MEKGVAAPAPETSLKWLGRTREGGSTCLRQYCKSGCSCDGLRAVVRLGALEPKAPQLPC